MRHAPTKCAERESMLAAGDDCAASLRTGAMINDSRIDSERDMTRAWEGAKARCLVILC
jgi:hypothetical protein